MAHVQKNPTKLSKCNWWSYQHMELANMLANDTAATDGTAPASTGISKNCTTGRKGEGTKEGQLLASIVAEGHKITNT